MKIFKYILMSAWLITAGACDKANRFVDITEDPINTSGLSGEVSGTWAKGTTVNITGDIIIPAGKRLVIQEGVTVVMDPVKKPEFIVQGNLYSFGTQENPVRITTTPELRKPDSWGQNWGGILADKTCEEMVLDNTIIEYGGATTTQASTSVKYGLYKAKAGENVPALWFSNTKGKLILRNSVVKNFHDDATYLEGGSIIVTGCKFYSTGNSGGEGVNIKSGCLADVSYNLFYSNNTNALKLSNSGDRTPQAHVVAYNNTILNTGWRRPDIKGGSVWLENSVYAEIYNTIFANTRFGIKQDTKSTPDKRCVSSNNLYYAYTAAGVTGFTPNGKDRIGGANDIIDTNTPGTNDPKFMNYLLNTDLLNYVFNDSWDFHLQTGSPALGKGTTNFTRNHPNGLIVDGITYPSPAPSTFIGAFGTK